MLVTARKNRKCDYCGNQIVVGERYHSIKIKITTGYGSFKQKSYHTGCYEQHEKELMESNVKALREMSPSAKNLNRIRSDNE